MGEHRPLMVEGIVAHGKYSRGKWQLSDEELGRVLREAHREGARHALWEAAGEAHSLPFLTRWWDLQGWLEHKAEEQYKR